MRRMIPIRLKSNSVQAWLHISSAILLFVFPGRSPTTGFFYETIIHSADGDNSNWMMLRRAMLSLFNVLLMEIQAGGLGGKQQRRNISKDIHHRVTEKLIHWWSSEINFLNLFFWESKMDYLHSYSSGGPQRCPSLFMYCNVDCWLEQEGKSTLQRLSHTHSLVNAGFSERVDLNWHTIAVCCSSLANS